GLHIDLLGEPHVVRVGATSDPLDLPARPDIVMIGAKAHDVGPMVNATTLDPRLVFSVQNGVGKDDVLVERFGRDRVVGCVSMVGGTLHRPGHAAYTFTGLTYLGDVAGSSPGGAAEIAALIDATGVLGAEVRDDIESVVWSKAVLACGAMG
ncbi:MAG: hypothetical protein GWN07_28665, partial [Actinobacteria bacterium]|nr:hypothetical protein [Actinomycetota bacterium]NIS28871.1 hypothetical protein [Actinomycetota bacterium]NIU69356.1 hypothetical protein [Actinomycetota bacterium]NIW31221.1 hypothetical protein [Actinomycetota bacterium]NIX23584.1 hypothetical protein [Actinomycetota bacterium]